MNEPLINAMWEECRESILKKDIPEDILTDFKVIYMAGVKDCLLRLSDLMNEIDIELVETTRSMYEECETKYLKE